MQTDAATQTEHVQGANALLLCCMYLMTSSHYCQLCQYCELQQPVIILLPASVSVQTAGLKHICVLTQQSACLLIIRACRAAH